MTTAPTPSDAERLAELIERGPQRQGDALIAAELRRLQAENERLLAQVHKLEMDALDLASENSILKRQDSELEARKPLPLSDEQIAGLRGQKGSPPDLVRLLEMAQALYKAEADARVVDKSPNLQEPLVDKTANLQDRPTAMPSITGGSS